MVMVLAVMLAGALARPLVPLSAPQATAAPLVGLDCQRLLSGSPGPGVAQLCQAESAMRTTDSATLEPAEQRRRFEAAAMRFDAAAAALIDPVLKVYAFEALARLFDAQHLNNPPGMERALRSLVPLMPGDSSPLRRVAQLQESLGLVDAAENTLLEAKQQSPGDPEIYRALSHFFARRAVQVSADPSRLENPADRAPGPDEPDADGYYSLGGRVSNPAPLSTPAPVSPRAASAAGVGGAVVLEVRVDEWGAVSGATVLQSVPLLDDAVVAAVKTWRYTPSSIDDRPVPVKLKVVVNVQAAAPR